MSLLETPEYAAEMRHRLLDIKLTVREPGKTEVSENGIDFTFHRDFSRSLPMRVSVRVVDPVNKIAEVMFAIPAAHF